MDKLKALCPTCRGHRNCTIHGKITTHWEDSQHPIYGYYHHHLLQCDGCETVFYHQNEHFSEHTTHKFQDGEWTELPIDMITTFPAIQDNHLPSWLPKLESADAQLFQIFNEVYFSYRSNHFILSAIGLRTIFDRTAEILKIHPRLGLNTKVEKLKDEGFIGDTEAQILKTVIDAGNAAAHRGWSPNKVEFEQLLEAIEGFVKRTVLADRTLAHISQNIPPIIERPKN